MSAPQMANAVALDAPAELNLTETYDLNAVDGEKSPFQLHYEEQSACDPSKKKLILTLAITGIIFDIKGEDLLADYYNCVSWHKIKPTIPIITKELKRRIPEIKGIFKAKLEEILNKLKETNDRLTQGC